MLRLLVRRISSQSYNCNGLKKNSSVITVPSAQLPQLVDRRCSFTDFTGNKISQFKQRVNILIEWCYQFEKPILYSSKHIEIKQMK